MYFKTQVTRVTQVSFSQRGIIVTQVFSYIGSQDSRHFYNY